MAYDDHLHEQVHKLEYRCGVLSEIIRDAMLLIQHGDYSNGNTDPTGSMDEGNVLAGRYIADLEARCIQAGVQLRESQDETPCQEPEARIVIEYW